MLPEDYESHAFSQRLGRDLRQPPFLLKAIAVVQIEQKFRDVGECNSSNFVPHDLLVGIAYVGKAIIKTLEGGRVLWRISTQRFFDCSDAMRLFPHPARHTHMRRARRRRQRSCRLPSMSSSDRRILMTSPDFSWWNTLCSGTRSLT